MEIEKPESISLYTNSGQRIVIHGTKRFQSSTPPYFERVDPDTGDEYAEKPRRPTTPEGLVKLFLDGDDLQDFPQSRCDYWLECARLFLGGVTYKTSEHKDLLLIGFRKFLMDKDTEA